MMRGCRLRQSWFAKSAPCAFCGKEPRKIFWNLVQDDQVLAQISEEVRASIGHELLRAPRMYLGMLKEAIKNLIFSLGVAAKAGPIVFFWLAVLALAAGPRQVLDLLGVLDFGPLTWTAMFLSGWFLASAAVAGLLGLLVWLWRDGLRLRYAVRQAVIREACLRAGVAWKPGTQLRPELDPRQHRGGCF